MKTEHPEYWQQQKSELINVPQVACCLCEQQTDFTEWGKKEGDFYQCPKCHGISEIETE